MNVTVANLQKRFKLNRRAMVRLVRFFMERASRMDATKVWAECSVVVVGHARMSALNLEALHHPGTTDVITFSYPTTPGEEQGWRGEIVVNIEEAAEVGARRAGGPSRELALYIAHGCQHLGGADDATPTQRAAMNRRQNRWLLAASQEGLVSDLYTCPERDSVETTN